MSNKMLKNLFDTILIPDSFLSGLLREKKEDKNANFVGEKKHLLKVHSATTTSVDLEGLGF